MELNLLESNFFNISKITQVKAFNSKLDGYEVDDSILSGTIVIDINYYDTKLEEMFVSKEIDFTIMLKEDMEVNDIKINDMRLEVIDNQGVTCYYEIILNTKMIERQKESFQEISKKENEKNEELKQEIKENYDTLLSESLEKRKEEQIEVVEESVREEEVSDSKKIEIISTMDNRNERSFLDFFDNTRNNFSVIKKIAVNNEAYLNQISKDYNISIDDLYKKYDKENKCVVIKIHG